MDIEQYFENLNSSTVSFGSEFEDSDFGTFDPTAFEPNSDQSIAIRHAEDWLTGNSGKQTFSLSGLAGTGKSSLVPTLVHLARSLGYSPKVATPTGKAACVVNAKLRAAGLGGRIADTIHSLAYRPVGSKKDETRKDHLGREIHNPIFERSEFDAQLVFVDEASMVSEKVYSRLMDNPTKYFFIGDYGQLPPVGDGDISPTLRNPDYTLTEIVRQAVDSPIRKLAYAVREGYPLSTPTEGIPYIRLPSTAAVAESFHKGGGDMLIAATNKVRHAMNQHFRVLQGYADKPHFSPGEKIIITSTSRTYGVFNGEIYYIEKVYHRNNKHAEGEIIKCDIVDRENNRTIRGIDLGYQWRTEHAFGLGIAAADYGGCLTCHKAQGSQGKKVGVIDSYIGWMGAQAPLWNYTSLTRSEDKLAIFKIG